MATSSWVAGHLTTHSTQSLGTRKLLALDHKLNVAVTQLLHAGVSKGCHLTAHDTLQQVVAAGSPCPEAAARSLPLSPCMIACASGSRFMPRACTPWFFCRMAPTEVGKIWQIDLGHLLEVQLRQLQPDLWQQISHKLQPARWTSDPGQLGSKTQLQAPECLSAVARQVADHLRTAQCQTDKSIPSSSSASQVPAADCSRELHMNKGLKSLQRQEQ